MHSMTTLDTPATLLVVDDDPFVRDLIALVLEDEGYTVVCAANHAEARQLAQTHCPAIILMDLSIPGLQGKDLIAAYRQIPSLGASIILISGRSNLERFATEVDVEGHLAKPFDVEILASLVNRVISERSRRSLEMIPSTACVLCPVQ